MPAAEQARVAFMRFGLGPSRLTTSSLANRLWTEPDAAYERCRKEVNMGAEITDPALLKDVLSRREVELTPTGKLPGAINYEQEQLKNLRQRMKPAIGFAERLVLFWMNHFNICNSARPIEAQLAPFEREVIRPLIFGKFEDLLVGVSQSLPMLEYLNGAKSTASTPNQNFAREILELHTVGSSADYTGRDVDANSNYSQDDVEALTYILTGWKVQWRNKQGETSDPLAATQYLVPPSAVNPGFSFRADQHDKHDRTLLGTTYRYNNKRGEEAHNVERGIAALRDLAKKPQTGKRIAYKLLRHFVMDEPDEQAVTELAGVFDSTGGDLRLVSLHLLDMDIAWTTPLNRLRQPYPWFVSVLRGLGMPLEGFFNLHTAFANQDWYSRYTFLKFLYIFLDTINQRPGFWPTPDGYPDNNAYWLNGDALRKRPSALFEFLSLLSKNSFPRGIGRELVAFNTTNPSAVRVKVTKDSNWKDVPATQTLVWSFPDASNLATSLFPEGLSIATRSAMAEAVQFRDNLGALTLLFCSSEYVKA